MNPQPVEPGSLVHRHGGRIERVTHIAHATERGVATWFYVGDVLWHDGSRSVGIEIAPICLCHLPDDEKGRALVNKLLGQLNAYLVGAGTWHDDKHARDGRVYRWTPHLSAGRVEVLP